MHEIDYWLFDWDGCIADTLGSWVEAVSGVAKEFGLSLTDKQLKEQFRDLTSAKRHGLRAWNLPRYIYMVRERAMAMVSSARISDGAEELFHVLKSENKNLAVVTSAPVWVKDMVRERKLDRYFDAVVTSMDVGINRMKPNPYPLEMALGMLRGRKESAIMVGDSPDDIEAASRAGIKSVRFVQMEGLKLYDDSDFTRFKPNYTVHSFREMIRLSRPKSVSRI